MKQRYLRQYFLQYWWVSREPQLAAFRVAGGAGFVRAPPLLAEFPRRPYPKEKLDDLTYYPTAHEWQLSSCPDNDRSIIAIAAALSTLAMEAGYSAAQVMINYILLRYALADPLGVGGNHSLQEISFGGRRSLTSLPDKRTIVRWK